MKLGWLIWKDNFGGIDFNSALTFRISSGLMSGFGKLGMKTLKHILSNYRKKFLIN